MAKYRLNLDEMHPHPSGNTTCELQLHMKFDGNDELITKIQAAVAEEIINWQKSQKTVNKS